MDTHVEVLQKASNLVFNYLANIGEEIAEFAGVEDLTVEHRGGYGTGKTSELFALITVDLSEEDFAKATPGDVVQGRFSGWRVRVHLLQNWPHSYSHPIVGLEIDPGGVNSMEAFGTAVSWRSDDELLTVLRQLIDEIKTRSAQ